MHISFLVLSVILWDMRDLVIHTPVQMIRVVSGLR